MNPSDRGTLPRGVSHKNGSDPNGLVEIRTALAAIQRLGPSPHPLDLGEPIGRLAAAARALDDLGAETVRLAALDILRETCGMTKGFADVLLSKAWRVAAGPEREGCDGRSGPCAGCCSGTRG